MLVIVKKKKLFQFPDEDINLSLKYPYIYFDLPFQADTSQHSFDIGMRSSSPFIVSKTVHVK